MFVCIKSCKIALEICAYFFHDAQTKMRRWKKSWQKNHDTEGQIWRHAYQSDTKQGKGIFRPAGANVSIEKYFAATVGWINKRKSTCKCRQKQEASVVNGRNFEKLVLNLSLRSDARNTKLILAWHYHAAWGIRRGWCV